MSTVRSIAPRFSRTTLIAWRPSRARRASSFTDGGLIFGSLHEEIFDNIAAVVVPGPGAFGLFALGSLLLGRRLHRTQKP